MANKAGPGGTRPWWAHPALWVALSATFLLLGIFVTPKLLGGVVILPVLWPFLWPFARPGARSKRRSPGPDPSQNGSRGRPPS